MLKVDKRFVEELQRFTHTYDEINDKINEYITDEFTKGYFICMLEQIWGEIWDYEERNEDVVDFAKKFVI